jgi:hypothetical protein
MRIISKMKITYLEKLLLVLVIAIVIFHFGHKHRPSIDKAPALVKSVQAPTVTIVDPSPAVVQIVHPQKPSNALADTVALIRLKLRQWRESSVNDPDDEIYRAKLLQEMLAMVTDANVAEIIQSLTPEEMNTPFGSGALHHWMQVDPLTASNWLASHPDASEDQILTVAGDWTGNPAGLQQYIDQLPDTAWKQNFIQDASSEMSFKDPHAAIKLAQQMKPGDAQTNLLRAVVSGWVGTNPNGALDWINSVNDPSLREQMTASAAQAYAVTDPAQAAAWLVSGIKSDGIVKDSALNILETWVATDPAAAAAWASQFPEGDTKAAAVKIVSNHWMQTDPDAASAWLQNLAGSPEIQPN